VIAPLGLLLGFGFHTGMRLVNAIDPRPTPWFWAINGAAGVLAASVAVAVNIAFSIRKHRLLNKPEHMARGRLLCAHRDGGRHPNEPVPAHARGLSRPVTIRAPARLPGTMRSVGALPCCWCATHMEDTMCYSRDYRIFDDKKKAQETGQERRAGVIDRLLDDANKLGEKTKAEGPPVKDIVPAK
jgi:hypothetical protein